MQHLTQFPDGLVVSRTLFDQETQSPLQQIPILIPLSQNRKHRIRIMLLSTSFSIIVFLTTVRSQSTLPPGKQDVGNYGPSATGMPGASGSYPTMNPMPMPQPAPFPQSGTSGFTGGPGMPINQMPGSAGGQMGGGGRNGGPQEFDLEKAIKVMRQMKQLVDRLRQMQQQQQSGRGGRGPPGHHGHGPHGHGPHGYGPPGRSFPGSETATYGPPPSYSTGYPVTPMYPMSSSMPPVPTYGNPDREGLTTPVTGSGAVPAGGGPVNDGVNGGMSGKMMRGG